MMMQRNIRIVVTAKPGAYSGAELAGQMYAPYTDDRLAKALVQMSVSYQDSDKAGGRDVLHKTNSHCSLFGWTVDRVG